jgi:AbrB family looped-hinge helix DNA binding protein
MKILERGQITIPKKLRDHYGITPSTELDFVEVKDGILIVKKHSKNNPFRDVYGILQKPGSTDAYIEKVRGR